MVGHGRDGRSRLHSARLEHHDPQRGRTVSVETTREPWRASARTEHDDATARGEVSLPVDGRAVRLQRYDPSPDDEWEWTAVGEIDGLGVTVQAVGVEPGAVALTVGVDPEPYLAGGRTPGR